MRFQRLEMEEFESEAKVALLDFVVGKDLNFMDQKYLCVSVMDGIFLRLFASVCIIWC